MKSLIALLTIFLGYKLVKLMRHKPKTASKKFLKGYNYAAQSLTNGTETEYTLWARIYAAKDFKDYTEFDSGVEHYLRACSSGAEVYYD